MDEITAAEVRGFRFIASSQLKPAWVCQTCGVATLDYTKHAGWHENLRQALFNAGSQYGPGQPLERV